MAYGDIYASQSNTLEDWLKQMGGQQESGNPFSSANNEFSAQQDPQQDQINAVGGEPQTIADAMEGPAENTDGKSDFKPLERKIPGKGDRTISKVAGIVGNVFAGPIGGAVLGGAARVVEGARDGEDATSSAQEGIKSAGISYLGGQAAGGYLGGQAAGGLGETAQAAGDATVAAGGNSLMASEATNATTTLGDAYRVSALDGAKLQTDPALYQATASKGVAPTLTQAAPSIGEQLYGVAKNRVRGATHGLIGGDFSAREGTGSFMNDFINGLENGGGIDTGVGSIRGGAYGEALGSGTKFVLNNYRPPQPAPAPRFTQDEYRKRNRYA